MDAAFCPEVRKPSTFRLRRYMGVSWVARIGKLVSYFCPPPSKEFKLGVFQKRCPLGMPGIFYGDYLGFRV